MSRKNSVIAVSSEGTVLTFTVGGSHSFTIDTAALSDEIRSSALNHGIVQKISDAAAMPKADLTGDAKKDAKTKFEAMRSVAERLQSGDWSKRSGDGSGPVAGIIFRAFEQWVNDMAAKSKKPAPDHDAIRARYDAMDRAGQLALRNVPAIATIIEKLKSERGSTAAPVDTSALLGELGL